MKINVIRPRRMSAFSLVEMLVVIAVIGVIAAIAVPNIQKINRSSRYAKDQRNAQQIASVSASAEAAGHNFVGTLDDEADVIPLVVGGHTITATENPSLEGTFFGLPNLSTTDQTGAANFLSVTTDGRLVYDPDETAITDDYYN